MDYKQYARKIDMSLSTGIHTNINKDYRISSIYRKYSNPYFESWAWETFLWNGDRIEEQYDTLYTADQVVDLHTKIVSEFVNKK